MLLTKTTPVPSGMSFNLDTGPAPRLAYLLSTPGNAAVVTLTGGGTWAVEVLASKDGLDFQVVGTQQLPGQVRYDTKGAVAVAIRVAAYTTGEVVGMLTHGGTASITNVSALLNSFLVYSYNSTTVEPPTGNRIRLNAAQMLVVTKAWIRNTSVDGTDHYQALRKLPVGGTLLLQDRDDHTHAALFIISGPVVDKTSYVEVPLFYIEHSGNLVSSQTMLAVFNPGPSIRLAAPGATTLPAPPPRETPPVLTALDPPAMPLGSPDFTLHVRGTGFVDSDVIEWNGGIEPTMFVSDTELTTGVNMATAAVVMPIPIVVVTPEGLRSNELLFDLGGFPPAADYADDAPKPRKRKVPVA